MYVTRLSLDDWDTGDGEGAEIANPELEDIDAAIRGLDGDRRTLAILAVDGSDTHMAVGGGERGTYIVYVTYNNEEFFNLIDPDAPSSEDKVTLYIGGQEGDYATKYCVNLGIALQAAVGFAVDGSLDRSLAWERQE